MKLNLGCGSQVVAGWTNVDWAPGARLAKLPLFKAINRKLRFFRADWHKDIVLHDLTRPFPWPEESVDVVYSSHTLEHPSKEEGLKFLKECHRVLRRGGIIRILVPDLAASCSGTIPASCARRTSSLSLACCTTAASAACGASCSSWSNSRTSACTTRRP